MLESILMPVRKLYPAIAGRSRRKEFWAFFLFNFLLVVAFFALFGSVIGAAAFSPDNAAAAIGAGTVLLFLLMIPFAFWMYLAVPATIAVMARRLHDQDRSAWLMLLMIIPYLGFLIMLVFMCLEGTRGPNRYGPDPKDPQGVNVFD
jgi:uncharacterized membrane protein YhaH (DUF805 family)